MLLRELISEPPMKPFAFKKRAKAGGHQGGQAVTKLPAMLWDALQPEPALEFYAEQIIADIIWACMKVRNWKANRERGEQQEPLVFEIYRQNLSPDDPENQDLFPKRRWERWRLARNRPGNTPWCPSPMWPG
jgi:hypothetical protein